MKYYLDFYGIINAIGDIDTINLIKAFRLPANVTIAKNILADPRFSDTEKIKLGYYLLSPSKHLRNKIADKLEKYFNKKYPPF